MSNVTGIGVGLRMDLAEDLLAHPPPCLRWMEIHPENYMRRGGRYPSLLEVARDRFPIVTHGLTMGFGNTDPAPREYLKPLRNLLADLGTPWHSDHMCFGGAHGHQVHDLLPTPFHEESLRTMVARYREARDYLDRELAFENLSYYANAPESEMDEPTFCVELLEAADAKMLLDVNNVYVNSKNHGFDPRAWIDQIPGDRVVQIHIAGHLIRPDGFRIDTHGEPIETGVYDLLDYTLRKMGPKPVLLERDQNFPQYDDLVAELEKLAEIYDRATAEAAA